MEVLRIDIHVLEQQNVHSDTMTICMIHFDGSCDNAYFRGKVLQEGVDTQMIETDKPGILSARYILAGIDGAGEKCRIFIENNGIMDGEGVIHTTPKIYTDSVYLKWLEKAELSGKVLIQEDTLTIVIDAEKEYNT